MALGGEHDHAAWERTSEQARQQQAHQVEVGQIVHLHTSQDQINYLWTCYLYGPVCSDFDAGKYITRASKRGLGPGNQDF